MERKLNPDEVLPKRNLPPGSEQWGRAMETRVRAVEKFANAERQFQQGANRNTASSLSTISDQVKRISESSEYVEYTEVVTIGNGAGVDSVVTGPLRTLTKPEWATAINISAGVTVVEVTGPDADEFQITTRLPISLDSGDFILDGSRDTAMSGGINKYSGYPIERFVQSQPTIFPVTEEVYAQSFCVTDAGSTFDEITITLKYLVSVQWLGGNLPEADVFI